MKCKDCAYYYEDLVEVVTKFKGEILEYTLEPDGEGEYCHWKSRCPGDIAPCEED